MTVGQRICNRRQELGWTQEELAFKMGYQTRNAIYQIEKSENMKLSLIEKFASVLDCPVSYLMGWEETDDPQPNKQNELLISYFAQLTPEQQESVLNLVKNMV